MNERIKLLADQAWEYARECQSSPDEDNEDSYYRNFQEKFAELIVKECVNVIDDVYNCAGQGAWYEGYLSGIAECKRKTEEHFGVDE